MKVTKNTPAFPVPDVYDTTNGEMIPGRPGMSARLLIATHVMSAFLNRLDQEGTAQGYAKVALEAADALIEEDRKR